MPTYSIPGPDGKTYSIDGPEGASKADIVKRVKSSNPYIRNNDPAEIRQDKGLLGRVMERAGLPTTLQGAAKGVSPLSAVMAPIAAGEEALATLGQKIGIHRPVSRNTGEASDRPDIGDFASRMMSIMTAGGGLAKMSGTVPKPKVRMDLGKAKEGLVDAGKFRVAEETPYGPRLELENWSPHAAQNISGGAVARPPKNAPQVYVPPATPVTPTSWQQVQKVAGSLKDKLPQDYPVWKARPTSGVVTAFENARVIMDGIMEKANKLKGLYSATHADWIKAEQDAYLAGRMSGNSMQAAMAQLPPEMRQVVGYMNSNRPAAKWARRFLTGEKLTDEPLYIVPHIVQEDYDKALALTHKFQGLSNDFKSTLGAFEKDRQFPTMLEGMVKGNHQYVDARSAILFRIWADAKLIHTAKFLQKMVLNKDLFATERAAMAASPSRQAFLVDAFPGSKSWWATTREEALWLKHHLQDPHVLGSTSRLVQFGNRWFRNFNLWNPLPHFAKNMLYKYGFSGGNPLKVFQDMSEIKNNTNPGMIDLYKKYMPYTDQGSSWELLKHPITGTKGGTAYDLLSDSMQKIAGMSNYQKFQRVISAPNNASSRLLFSKWDPWLKYSRFKQYVESGKLPQDAANQVHMDLIRYSMRSDLVDIWKSIPFNFFVPWRVGTMQSMVKNFQQAPYQAALWVAGMDLLREIYYRKTGDYFHMPADYLIDPLVRTVESAMGGYTKRTKTVGARGQRLGEEMAKLTLTTGAWGPGGQYSGKQLGDIIKVATTGKLLDPALRNMFWGFTLIGDPRTGARAMAQFAKDGNPKHLVDIFLSATVATHTALNNAPHRMSEVVPEFTPAFTRSTQVKKAEAMQKARDIRREAPRRPHKSIEEILRVLE